MMMISSSANTVGLALMFMAAVFVGSHATYYPSVLYLDQICGSTYSVSGDLRIKLAFSYYLNPNIQCTVTLLPKTGNRVVASFLRYSINPGYVSYGTCTVESIQLSSPTTVFFGPTGYCQPSKPSSQYDLGSLGTFTFTTWSYSYIIAADVDLLVTEVQDRALLSSCPIDYFDCNRKSYCIHEDLTCNGYDDCGNNRDEIVGCGFYLSTTVTAVVVLGCIFFFAFLVVVGIFARRRYRRMTYSTI